MMFALRDLSDILRARGTYLLDMQVREGPLFKYHGEI